MKLKLPIIYSQRDPKWGNILLGYNTNSQYNIYSFGCLITCLSMEVDKTPDEVNQILKDNSGFQVGGGLFIWSKSTVLGLNQQYVSTSWNGPVTDNGVQTAKDYLDKGYPLICEIDFNPATIGEEMHFIVCTGYDGDTFYIADPWTGTEDSFDKYGGFRRAVIQFRVYDKKFPSTSDQPDLQGQLDGCRFDRDSHWNDLMAIWGKLRLNGDYSISIVLGELDKLIGYEDTLRIKEAELAAQQQQVLDIQKKANDLDKQVGDLSSANTAAQDTIAKQTQEIADMKKSMEGQATVIQTLQTQIDDLKKTTPLNMTGALTLIWVGIKKLFGR